MAKSFPVTQGIRFLKAKKVEFEQYEYEYQEKGGTKQTAIELSVDEHAVIKTLVFMDESGNGCICLQHGDREVSTKELARQIQCKTLAPAPQDKAMKWTGYQFGGTSPFGTKAQLPIYAESTIFDLDTIYINGGKRGFILGMNPKHLLDILSITKVEVAI